MRFYSVPGNYALPLDARFCETAGPIGFYEAYGNKSQKWKAIFPIDSEEVSEKVKELFRRSKDKKGKGVATFGESKANGMVDKIPTNKEVTQESTEEVNQGGKEPTQFTKEEVAQEGKASIGKKGKEPTQSNNAVAPQVNELIGTGGDNKRKVSHDYNPREVTKKALSALCNFGWKHSPRK